jgi:glycosyltransferase involved in cell wall biosynthesis
VNINPKISVITVCKNAAQYIRESIESVVSQDYSNVEYIIIDGKSDDDTLAIIEEYKSKINIIKSETDSGPADALTKGFALASGDILCWLNADDKFHPYALSSVAKIFSELPQVNWLTGFPSWYTPDGACVNELYIQTESNLNVYVNDAFYHHFNRWSLERFLAGDYLAIQQESVFWRKEVWQQSGATLTKGLTAFDFELWSRFFLLEKLYTAPIVLSGFRVHGNQLSADQKRYMAACKGIIAESKGKLSPFRQFLTVFRNGLARFFKPFYYLDFPLLKNAYPLLMNLPPVITHDSDTDQFFL